MVNLVACDLPGTVLAASYQNTIFIDTLAGGFGWFADATPDSDEEFNSSGSVFKAKIDGAADNRFDLISVIMYEMVDYLNSDKSDNEASVFDYHLFDMATRLIFKDYESLELEAGLNEESNNTATDEIMQELWNDPV